VHGITNNRNFVESSFENSNKNIHSTNECVCLDIDLDLLLKPLPSSRIDISDEFSFSHMLEFSKLAVAYVVELSSFDSSKK